MSGDATYDVFVCHASVDKARLVEPLVTALVEQCDLSMFPETNPVPILRGLRSHCCPGRRARRRGADGAGRCRGVRAALDLHAGDRRGAAQRRPARRDAHELGAAAGHRDGPSLPGRVPPRAQGPPRRRARRLLRRDLLAPPERPRRRRHRRPPCPSSASTAPPPSPSVDAPPSLPRPPALRTQRPPPIGERRRALAPRPSPRAASEAPTGLPRPRPAAPAAPLPETNPRSDPRTRPVTAPSTSPPHPSLRPDRRAPRRVGPSALSPRRLGGAHRPAAPSPRRRRGPLQTSALDLSVMATTMLRHSLVATINACRFEETMDDGNTYQSPLYISLAIEALARCGDGWRPDAVTSVVMGFMALESLRE
jgi:hypothetical protein